MIIFFQSNRFSISIISQMKQIFEHYSSSILHSFPHFIHNDIFIEEKCNNIVFDSWWFIVGFCQRWFHSVSFGDRMVLIFFLRSICVCWIVLLYTAITDIFSLVRSRKNAKMYFHEQMPENRGEQGGSKNYGVDCQFEGWYWQSRGKKMVSVHKNEE